MKGIRDGQPLSICELMLVHLNLNIVLHEMEIELGIEDGVLIDWAGKTSESFQPV